MNKLLSLLDFSKITSTGFNFIKYKRGKNSLTVLWKMKNERIYEINEDSGGYPYDYKCYNIYNHKLCNSSQMLIRTCSRNHLCSTLKYKPIKTELIFFQRLRVILGPMFFFLIFRLICPAHLIHSKMFSSLQFVLLQGKFLTRPKKSIYCLGFLAGPLSYSET